MRKGVRQASLSYTVQGEADGLTLVRVQLHTGRTHQIRVQFSPRHRQAHRRCLSPAGRLALEFVCMKKDRPPAVFFAVQRTENKSGPLLIHEALCQ